jgi:uncharacterized protein (TIGR02391 family)
MLLTDNELRLVRQAIETQAGYDGELIARCGPLFSIEAFDNAVQQAFVVLEERLRKALSKERATGRQLIDYGFSSEGPFTKSLEEDPAEREALKALFTGAFSLYRNPAAHTIVGYDRAEARAIISLVDLLLKRLDRLASMRQPARLHPAAQQALAAIAAANDAQVAARTRAFIGKCLNLGYEIRLTGKQWIPFIKTALAKYDQWPAPRPHQVTAFYLYTSAKDQGLWFPVNQLHTHVVGCDIEQIKSKLKALEFKPTGKYKDYSVSFGQQNSQAFFDAVCELLASIAKAWDASLNDKGG